MWGWRILQRLNFSKAIVSFSPYQNWLDPSKEIKKQIRGECSRPTQTRTHTHARTHAHTHAHTQSSNRILMKSKTTLPVISPQLVRGFSDFLLSSTLRTRLCSSKTSPGRTEYNNFWTLPLFRLSEANMLSCNEEFMGRTEQLKELTM